MVSATNKCPIGVTTTARGSLNSARKRESSENPGTPEPAIEVTSPFEVIRLILLLPESATNTVPSEVTEIPEGWLKYAFSFRPSYRKILRRYYILTKKLGPAKRNGKHLCRSHLRCDDMGYNSLEIPAHLNQPSLSQLLFQCQIIHVTGSKHKETTEGKFKPAGWHPNSYASSALSGVEIIKKHNAVTNTGVAVQPRTIIIVWPRLSQLWKHSHSGNHGARDFTEAIHIFWISIKCETSSLVKR